MLKRTRVIVAVIVLAMITFYFIDFAGLLSNHTHWLAKLQLIPAILALNLGIIVFLIILTLLIGRFYCSSICPMGIFQDVITWFSRSTSKKRKKKGFKYSKAKNILRYTILSISIIALISGFTVVLALIEPYSIYGRFATHLLKPTYIAGNNLLASLTASSGEYWFSHTNLIIESMFALVSSIITILIISFLAWKYGRTYCNTICPAGTILGTISKYSIYKVRINSEKCNSCGLCERKCKASCINSKEKSIDYSRCVDCFNCLGTCKRNALSFAPSHPTATSPKDTNEQVDPSRRQFLATTAATAIIVPQVLAQDKKEQVTSLLSNQKTYKKQYAISPPGSKSHGHLSAHCTSCHLCINRCPSKIIKPAVLEYGLGGIMQPVISYEDNFCEIDCTVCSDICPNGAIEPIPSGEKRNIQIGHAIFVPENCIVNTENISCGACARHCPVEAITLVPSANGFEIPSVNTNKCIGCGACEYICPVYPYRGIYVEGQTVHNQIKSV